MAAPIRPVPIQPTVRAEEPVFVVVHLTNLSHLLVQSFASKLITASLPVKHVRPRRNGTDQRAACSREASQSAVYGRCHGATFAQPWLPSSSISSSASPPACRDQPLGVLPRDEPVLASEDDQQRGGDLGGDVLEGQGVRDPAGLIVVAGAPERTWKVLRVSSGSCSQHAHRSRRARRARRRPGPGRRGPPRPAARSSRPGSRPTRRCGGASTSGRVPIASHDRLGRRRPVAADRQVVLRLALAGAVDAEGRQTRGRGRSPRSSGAPPWSSPARAA